MDRITQTLLGFGAGALLLWGAGSSGRAAGLALALGVGFAGVYRATRSGAVLALGALFVLGHLVASAGAIVPDEILYTDEQAAGVLHAIERLGSTLTLLAVAGATLVLRARAGTMLSALVAVAAVLTFLTGLGASFADIVIRWDDADDFRTVLLPIFRGQYTGALLLASGAFFVAALGPRLEAPRSAAQLCAGAVGGLLLVATMAGIEPLTNVGHSPVAALSWLLTMAIGWALTAAAMVGLARQGSPAAWAGLALAVVEILVCAPVPFVFSRPFASAMGIALLPAFFGLFGIAIALFGSRTLALPGARLVGGALVLLGALGTCAATSLVAAASDAIGLRIDTPFTPLSLTGSALIIGLGIWTAFLATLGTPPREVS